MGGNDGATSRRGPARTEPPPQPRHLPNPEEAAAEFWRRWFELLPEVNAALGEREPHRLENELCELVAGVHPDL
ncbi:MAG: hypothetical protein HOY78_29910, partial [Saccharothrix sp.]|nr:hypothetical protein [Saccharothrix sp.]